MDVPSDDPDERDRQWVARIRRATGSGIRIPLGVDVPGHRPEGRSTDSSHEDGGTTRIRAKHLGVGVVVTLMAALLRFFRLGARDVWYDEALSYHLAATRSLPELLFEFPLVAPNPPLYHAILHAWIGVGGTTEAALRFPSAVFGTAAVSLLFVFLLRLDGLRLATLGSGLLALSPFHVIYSQEARMYSLLAFLTIASMYLFVRLSGAWNRWDAVGYLSLTALLGYTHGYGLFVIAAQNLYVAFDRVRPESARAVRLDLERWVFVQVGIAVLLSPWVLVLVYRTFFAPTGLSEWLTPPSPIDIAGTPAHWVTGVGFHRALYVLVPVIGIAVVHAVASLRGADRDEFVEIAIVWAAVPLGLAALLSYLVRPIYHFRYTIVSSVGFFVLVAVGVDRLGVTPARLCCVALLVVGLAAPLPAYYTGEEAQPWGSVTDEIEPAADADDLVVVTNFFVQVPFAYYWNGSETTVRTVAGREPNAVLVQERYERIPENDVSDTVSRYDEVWLLVAHTDAQHERRLNETISSSKVFEARNERGDITVYHYRDED